MTPWGIRAAEVRSRAERVYLHGVPRGRQILAEGEERELTHEGQHPACARAHRLRAEFKAAGESAVDEWSDSAESESLMGVVCR